jgi:hypothetical protein
MTGDVNIIFRFFHRHVGLRTTLRVIRKSHSHSIVLGGLLEMS